MCHVPYTSSTRHRETDIAMSDLANAFRYRQAAQAKPRLMETAWHFFRLATSPLGHLQD